MTTSYVDPSDATIGRLLARGIDGPFTMLNLLRFKPVADYSATPELEPAEPISGRQAYERYMAETLPVLEAHGGSLTFVGRGEHCFIGPDDERWDLVLLVAQRSVTAFFAFATSEPYQQAGGHRRAALEDCRLVPLEADH